MTNHYRPEPDAENSSHASQTTSDAASASIPLPALPARNSHGHKGTFGTVAVIGGSCEAPSRMIGAPVLAASAALRSGAGLVRLVMPEPLLTAGLTILPSATGFALPTDPNGVVIAHVAAEVFDAILPTCHALVIGPGLGAGLATQTLTLRAVQQDSVPVIVDADGLNALASVPELHRDFRASAVLTPHPGEFARLARALRITTDPTQPATRPKAAAELAQRLGCVVVLKGSGTVVSDGYRTWTCSAGHHCLATAGTGDVLAGLIGGLIAQFVRLATPPIMPKKPGVPVTQPTPTFGLFEAAQIAVQVHARASELWAAANHNGGGLLAMELADLLPAALSEQRTRY